MASQIPVPRNTEGSSASTATDGSFEIELPPSFTRMLNELQRDKNNAELYVANLDKNFNRIMTEVFTSIIEFESNPPQGISGMEVYMKIAVFGKFLVEAISPDSPPVPTDISQDTSLVNYVDNYYRLYNDKFVEILINLEKKCPDTIEFIFFCGLLLCWLQNPGIQLFEMLDPSYEIPDAIRFATAIFSCLMELPLHKFTPHFATTLNVLYVEPEHMVSQRNIDPSHWVSTLAPLQRACTSGPYEMLLSTEYIRWYEHPVQKVEQINVKVANIVYELRDKVYHAEIESKVNKLGLQLLETLDNITSSKDLYYTVIQREMETERHKLLSENHKRYQMHMAEHNVRYIDASNSLTSQFKEQVKRDLIVERPWIYITSDTSRLIDKVLSVNCYDFSRYAVYRFGEWTIALLSKLDALWMKSYFRKMAIKLESALLQQEIEYHTNNTVEQSALMLKAFNITNISEIVPPGHPLAKSAPPSASNNNNGSNRSTSTISTQRRYMTYGIASAGHNDGTAKKGNGAVPKEFQYLQCEKDIADMTAYANRYNRCLGATSLMNEASNADFAKDAIRQVLKIARSNNFRLVLYYSGHGYSSCGDWAFKKGKITFEDMCIMVAKVRSRNSNEITFDQAKRIICDPTMQNPSIVIIADCCHAGHWVRKARRHGFDCGFYVIAASGPDDCALGNNFSRAFWRGEKYYIDEAVKCNPMLSHTIPDNSTGTMARAGHLNSCWFVNPDNFNVDWPKMLPWRPHGKIHKIDF